MEMACNKPETLEQRKILVRYLSPATTEEAVRRYFQKWGTIVCVKVKGYTLFRKIIRRYAFITYSRASMVDAAQDARPHILDDQVLFTSRVTPKKDRNQPEYEEISTRLYIFGFDNSLEENEFRKYFEGFGIVISCEIVKSGSKRRTEGYGFVRFSDYDPVDKLIQTNPHMLSGKKFFVRRYICCYRPEVYFGEIPKENSHSADDGYRTETSSSSDNQDHVLCNQLKGANIQYDKVRGRLSGQNQTDSKGLDTFHGSGASSSSYIQESRACTRSFESLDAHHQIHQAEALNSMQEAVEYQTFQADDNRFGAGVYTPTLQHGATFYNAATEMQYPLQNKLFRCQAGALQYPLQQTGAYNFGAGAMPYPLQQIDACDSNTGMMPHQLGEYGFDPTGKVYVPVMYGYEMVNYDSNPLQHHVPFSHVHHTEETRLHRSEEVFALNISKVQEFKTTQVVIPFWLIYTRYYISNSTIHGPANYILNNINIKLRLSLNTLYRNAVYKTLSDAQYLIYDINLHRAKYSTPQKIEKCEDQ